ncbi:Poliovirus receptor-related protein 2 [Stemphylium lycopersici]|uniref:Poliovirus receptor-related protein 2 n=1 Tax=Stemphylium lycopersici TaxID=183478 RepID=A0A364MW95_STELY|nr:Poliovirus receptor-related protein 2 [Stemphylium lycopersici]
MSNSSYFDFHCPTGGKWYACSSGSKFVGCCTADPCSNGCVQGNIRPGAYNISHHGEWPDASCGSASDFYTCDAGDSFWGCCKSNACRATPPSTCAQGDLVPAFLERPEQFSAYASASATPEPLSSDPISDKTNIGAIVGGVVGGVVALAIIGVVVFFVLRRKRSKKPAGGDMGAAAMIPMMNSEKGGHSGSSVQYGGQSPPPTYSAPVRNSYHDDPSNKGHQSHHQYASHANEPQELPTEVALRTRHQYSELPADASNGMDTRRFSELPAESPGPSELESPYVSPMPIQEEFSKDMVKRASRTQGLDEKRLFIGSPKGEATRRLWLSRNMPFLHRVLLEALGGHVGTERNLYPGAFDPDAYGTFPDATCGTGSKFYTCTASGTFWGCCKTNACAQSGCPDGDLEAAILNRDDLRSAYHATGGSTTVSSASSTSTLSTSTSTEDPGVTAASVPSSDAASPSPPPKSDDGPPVAAIAGGAAGGAFALAAAVGVLVWWLCLKRKNKAKEDINQGGRRENASGMTEGHKQHRRNQSADAPPQYTSPTPNFSDGFYSPPAHQHPQPYSHPPHPNYPQNTNSDDPYFSPYPQSQLDLNTNFSQASHHYLPPQELPLSHATPTSPRTPARFRSHKSMYGHARGPSELSGDEPRSELGSGPASPAVGNGGGGGGGGEGEGWTWNMEKGHHVQQQSVPPSQESNIGVALGSRRSPPPPLHQRQFQQQHANEQQANADAIARQQIWTAPRDWDSRGVREEFGGRRGDNGDKGVGAAPQGLGFLDMLDNMAEGRKIMDGQRAERRER